MVVACPSDDMTEHNGMDILCDAAGSDLLLTSFLTPSSPAPEPQQRSKRIKVADDDGASPTSPHVCHICKRVYERFVYIYSCRPVLILI